ncbi:MAG: multidrug efflux pump subunit AcrB [Dasania sp.]|jgi:multidrug efflux pump subunit AcrB
MKNYKTGLGSWFAQNHVAATLLMIFFLIGGFLSVKNMTKEVFPTIDPKMITISVSYPGASAADVEEAITQRAEEAVIGIDGIKKVSSTASEGVGSVTVELTEKADGIDVYNDIKNEIDSLQNFPPQNAERPIIVRAKPKSLVMNIAVFGDVPPQTLRNFAEKMEQDILQLPLVNDVDIRGDVDREISVFISNDTLQRYNLTHSQVANIISNSAINLPAGRIETLAGDILLRVEGRRYYANEYANIVIKAMPNGATLKLGDIATLEDGFSDERIISEFNGVPSLFLAVSRSKTQDVLKIEKSVRDYLEGLNIPNNIDVKIKFNRTDALKDRANLMIKNALIGFILLFIALILFLDLKLAFWISMGVPISFGGGLMLASLFGVTINMISLFALIIVIGIVVDDAIVVGESIFYEQETYPERSALENVMNGVHNVIIPATVGVSTTMIAFVPLMLTEGTFGQILGVIPVIVICILGISLVEAYLILPSHLMNPSRYSVGIIKQIRLKMDAGLNYIINHYVVPFVSVCIRFRYAAVTAVCGIIFLAISAVSNGVIRTVFFPAIEGSQITAVLEMPIDTPILETKNKIDIVYQAAEKTLKAFQAQTGTANPIHEGITLSVGKSVTESGPGGGGGTVHGQNIADVEVKLVEADMRDFSSVAFEKAWRKNVGSISGAKNLTYTSSLIRSGNDIEIEVSHKNSKTLQNITATMVDEIAKIEGVVSIKDSFEVGKKEYRFELTPAGYAAGLTPQSLGTALRGAFNGQEATRVRRGREEIKIMVRLPDKERQTLNILENYRIGLPNGQQAPLKEMALIKFMRGDSKINRVDGRRIISVIGDIDETVRTTDEVTAVIESEIIPNLMKQYPQMQYSYSGATKDRQEDTASLKTNTILVVFVIFALLAVQLRGYSMPFVIIANIPLGVAGAFYAHWILGQSVSFMSFFGIVALCGIVINDSVVLLDYYNQMRDRGLSAYDAMIDAVRRRFRAIMLTTLTNAVSTLPILLETSTQAQFLIPMATSLSGGLVFATILIFAFTPALMVIFDDYHELVKRIKFKIMNKVA